MSVGLWTGSNTIDQHPTNQAKARGRRNTISLTLIPTGLFFLQSIWHSIPSTKMLFLTGIYQHIDRFLPPLFAWKVILSLRLFAFIYVSVYCIFVLLICFVFYICRQFLLSQPEVIEIILNLFIKIKWWPRFIKFFCINYWKTSGVKDKYKSNFL